MGAEYTAYLHPKNGIGIAGNALEGRAPELTVYGGRMTAGLSGAPTADVERAYFALKEKQGYHDRYFDYYDNDAELPELVERLKEIFKTLNHNIKQNWCKIVVNSVADRITLKALHVSSDKAAEKMLADIWAVNSMGLEANEAHKDALITGESYVIAWCGEDDQSSGAGAATTKKRIGSSKVSPDAVEFYRQDPRLCHVFYEADNPRRVKFAAKWYLNDDEIYSNDDDRQQQYQCPKIRLTLYYPDRLEYYETEYSLDTNGRLTDTVGNFQPCDPPSSPNPYGVVPVFHFRTQLRRTLSDLKDVIPLQDGLNILFINMMAASEYSAAPQKYVISNAEIPERMQNSPGSIWELPAGDGMGQATTVGQFQAAQLKNYIEAMDALLNYLATISATPKHHFFMKSGEPSGEALMTMEAPLIKKTQDRIDRFAETWRHIGAFLCKLAGFDKIKPTDIVPVFDAPASIQPRTLAEIRTMEVQSGLPLVTILRREGWTDEEIARMEADQNKGQEKQIENQKKMQALQFEAEAEYQKKQLALAEQIQAKQLELAAQQQMAAGETQLKLDKKAAKQQHKLQMKFADEAVSQAQQQQADTVAAQQQAQEAAQAELGVAGVLPPLNFAAAGQALSNLSTAVAASQQQQPPALAPAAQKGANQAAERAKLDRNTGLAEKLQQKRPTTGRGSAGVQN